MSSAAHQVIQSDEEQSRAVKRALVFTALGIVAAIAGCTGGHFLYVFVSTADSADLADRYLSGVGRGQGLGGIPAHVYRIPRRAGAGSVRRRCRHRVHDDPRAGCRGKTGPWTTIDFNILTGTLTTASGRTLPFVLEVVEEEGEWRVRALTGPGRTGRGSRRMVPPGPERGGVEAHSPRDDAGLPRGREGPGPAPVLRQHVDGENRDIVLEIRARLSGFPRRRSGFCLQLRMSSRMFIDPPKLDRTSSGFLLRGEWQVRRRRRAGALHLPVQVRPPHMAPVQHKRGPPR